VCTVRSTARRTESTPRGAGFALVVLDDFARLAVVDFRRVVDERDRFAAGTTLRT
jgi:hypothetical protein